MNNPHRDTFEKDYSNDTGHKLSLPECRKILNKGDANYTDEELIKIRNWLYHFADLAMEHLGNSDIALENQNKSNEASIAISKLNNN